jgi:hypothetical protein
MLQASQIASHPLVLHGHAKHPSSSDSEELCLAISMSSFRNYLCILSHLFLESSRSEISRIPTAASFFVRRTLVRSCPCSCLVACFSPRCSFHFEYKIFFRLESALWSRKAEINNWKIGFARGGKTSRVALCIRAQLPLQHTAVRMAAAPTILSKVIVNVRSEGTTQAVRLTRG